MEDERNDEAAEEETDDQDQEEEENDEGGDTDSVKTYIKSIIPFDDYNEDDKRNPHATSAPKGNIQLYFIFVSNLMLAKIKYNPFYLCKLHLFPNYYCNPNQVKMSRQTNGFNWKYMQTKPTSRLKLSVRKI